MNSYKLIVEIISPTLIGSGDGWSSIIDADVIYDDVGLPYFPARNCKGILRESALEVYEMFKQAGLDYFEADLIDRIFGTAGDKEGGLLNFGNLYLPEYQALHDWCKWIVVKYKEVFSPSRIIESLTVVRDMTALQPDGTAQDNSLRRYRALRPGLKFEGICRLRGDNTRALRLLGLACLNIRHIGSCRHRGFGEVSCALFDNGNNLSAQYLKEMRMEVL